MKVFLSGVAGVGMSSLAGLFKQKGFDVSGSDVNYYPPVDLILKKMNIHLFDSYKAENIPADADCCVIGNVISRGNPEAEYILDHNITFYSMSEALYQFFIRGRQSVVVSGTHGKTTITSFFSYLLHYAGLQPGFFIGGKPLDFESNYAVGHGEHFVIEGDEYETAFFDRSSKFLKYHPRYLVISALEYDHLDFFPDENQYLRAFQNLVNQVPASGLIILNNDYPMNALAVEKAFTPVVTYGTRGNPHYVITDLHYEGKRYMFTLKKGSWSMPCITSLAGAYNAWNLTAGIVFGLHIGIPEQTIREAVESFSGVERRLNIIKEKENTLILEDFAHHPTSIKQVLSSIRDMYPRKRLVVFFEPRSWSLRRNFFQERLTDSFLDADHIFIKEVFQKEKIPGGQCLDVGKMAEHLRRLGKEVIVFDAIDIIKKYISRFHFSQDTAMVLLSNGGFDGLPDFVREF